MRKKERALADMGTVSFTRADDLGEVRRVLDVFFKQKSARMRARGITDVFAAAGVRRFIEAASTGPTSGGAPLIELYALSVDDIVVATMGGIVGENRFCAMFNSIAQGRYAVESPGEQLIVHLVRRCCERGLRHLRPRYRRCALQKPVLRRRRTAVRQLSAAVGAKDACSRSAFRRAAPSSASSSSGRSFGRWCAPRGGCAHASRPPAKPFMPPPPRRRRPKR